MTEKPWTSGPTEILQHAFRLLENDNDTYRRLAFLNIDNAVELIIKTYLGLPERVTGISMSRKAYNDAIETFPKLLTALESRASNILKGIDLGEIEWYHRLRNQLYHQGNGLTVEIEKVNRYAEISLNLMEILLDFVPSKETHEKEYELLIDFFKAWCDFEETVIALDVQWYTTRYGNKDDEYYPYFNESMNNIYNEYNLFSEIEHHEISKLVNSWKQIVERKEDYRSLISEKDIEYIKEMTYELSTRIYLLE